MFCSLLVISMTACSSKSDDDTSKKDDLVEELETKLNSYVNTPLKDSYQDLNDIGYKITYKYTKSDYDCTSEFENLENDSEWLDGWIITDINDIDHDKKTFTIYIETQESIDADQKENEMTKALVDKLDSAAAWESAEDYGEMMYPNGFKLHYITGKLNQSASDENTWFLKAEATITNTSGDKRDVICEAYVTGTTASPEVVDFIIY